MTLYLSLTCDSRMLQAPAKVDTNLTEWESHDIEQRNFTGDACPLGDTPTTNKLQPTCFPKKADENLKQDKHKTTEGMGGIAPPHAAFQSRPLWTAPFPQNTHTQVYRYSARMRRIEATGMSCAKHMINVSPVRLILQCNLGLSVIFVRFLQGRRFKREASRLAVFASKQAVFA